MGQPSSERNWIPGRSVRFVAGPFSGLVGKVVRVEANGVLIHVGGGVYIRVSLDRENCMDSSPN
jgi:hypothetical protein